MGAPIRQLLTDVFHMRHNCLMKSRRRLTSREALLEAGFRVLHHNPGASLSDIAEEAGVGRATLHRHFSSRELLVSELAQTAIAEMDSAVEEACRDSVTAGAALRDALTALIPLGDRYGFLMHEPLDTDETLSAEFGRQQRETEELVLAAVEEGVFDPAVPVSWIVRADAYLIYTAWEGVREEEVTPTQAADLAWRTLTAGLGRLA